MTTRSAQHSFRLRLIGGTLLIQAAIFAPVVWQEAHSRPDGASALPGILGMALLGGGLTVLLLVPLSAWLTRQLRRSETRLQYALLGSSDGIWDWDLREDDYYLSPRWKEMLGYHAEDLPNERQVFVDHLHPDDRQRVEAAIEGHFRQKGAYDIEYRLRHRDGHYFWCRARGQAVWDDMGRPVRFSGATTDISEQKADAARIEALLVEKQALLDNALVGITFVRHRKVVACNRRFEEMFGYAPGALIGQTTEALFPSPEVFQEISRAAYATLERGDPYSFELNLRRAEGTQFWARLSGRAIDPRQAEEASIWVYTDESERKDALDSVLEEQAFSQALISSLPGIFFLAGEDGKILRWNTNLEKELGYRRRRIVHMTATDLVPVDGRGSWEKAVDETLSTGRPASLESLLLAEDGRAVPYFLTATAIEAREARLVIVVGIDISARKRAEEEVRRLNEGLEQRVRERTAELTAANRELESFSYSVSHDLSSPLRGIDGFARIIEEDYGALLDDAGRNSLHRIRAATQRMHALIDDMLSLARITRNELAISTFSLSEMADRIFAELREGEPTRQVDSVVAPGLEATADANLVYVALQNLLRNAWKFTSRHPSARIEFGALRKDGETVYFVRDDGAGFDMRYASKLFREFQRLHRHQDFEGSGIGLAITSRVIQRHGGRIWSEAAIEQGATFYFTLPPKRQIGTPT